MLGSGVYATVAEAGTATSTVHVVARDLETRRRILVALRSAGARVATVSETLHLDPGCRGVYVLATPLGDDAIDTAVARVRLAAPHARIVVVDRGSRAHVARMAIKRGADAFLVESDVPVALGPAIHAVAAGQIVLPRDERLYLDAPALSARERETLGLLVEGLTNAEIAARLVLAESTVKSHLTTAFAKLGVRSRAQAVAAILDRDTGLGDAVVQRPRNGFGCR